MKSSLVYTAPWIFPIVSSPIHDGAIVINGDEIVEVGHREFIVNKFPEIKTIELQGVLIPPLVNCHIHLELSHLRNIPQPSDDATMVDWIEEIIQTRMDNYDENVIVEAMEEVIKEQYESGVILMADIANTAEHPGIIKSKTPEIISILEVLAPTKKRTAEVIESLLSYDENQFISPHSPYSSSAELISTLKRRATANDQMYSIHLAESTDEIELIRKKTGAFRRFLEKRDMWDRAMLPEEHGGAVEYLDSLNVLDEKTLCVHCVHINDNEIQLLAEKKVKVCLCPGSNEFLRVGRAPLEKMLEFDILPAIGTDSYASNKRLDIWREMQILRNNHPEVPPETLLAMASLGGARALGRSDCLGSLEKGKKPAFLEILLEGADDKTGKQILNILTGNGRPKQIKWIAFSDD